MKQKSLALIAAMLLSLSMTATGESQCVNGVCRMPQQQRVDRQEARVEARACHQAVCRIYVNDGGGTKSIGSGVLVRYLGRFVVLTAAHVVRDCRGAIHVRFGRRPFRWHQARLLCKDVVWDCAALEVTEPDGVEPAEIAWGEAATPKLGDTLESCGFGRNDTLRVNRGRLLGYKKTRNSTTGDWIEMSGGSRGGDSGGPMFDSAGRVVGVLWGTSGGTTLGAQGGRLHAMLTKVIRRQPPRRKPVPFGGRIVPVLPLIRPVQPRQPIQQPQVIVQSDPALRPAIEGIGGNVAQIEINTRPPAKEESKEGGTTPVGSALCILGALCLGFVLFFAVGKN